MLVHPWPRQLQSGPGLSEITVWTAAISFLTALAAAALLTPLAARWARHRGIVDRPGRHKGHAAPTPLLGGLAIYLALAAGAIAGTILGAGPGRLLAATAAGATLVFVLGLVDDLKDLPVGPRLLAQLGAAVLPVAAGAATGTGLAPIVSIPLALLWIAGITNAFNLLDNMDGLAAGAGSLTALMLAVLALQAGPPPGQLVPALAGACLGFLLFNFPPARIFMGDCGSLLIGFVLAVAALPLALGRGRPADALAVAAIFCLPLLDTSLVTVSRLRRGKNPLHTPGRDHLSHRLAGLGLGVRATILILYAAAAAAGAIGLWLFASRG